MKWIFSLLIILGIIGVSFGINDNDYLKLEIENKVNFDINFESKNNIEFFYLYNYFFIDTINGSQYLNTFESNLDNYNLIEKNNRDILSYDFSYDLKESNLIENKFIVESVAFSPKIKTKFKYPIISNNIDNQYLEFGDLIDINEDIKNLASSLATGEDDVYLISAKIAKWIREDINYDLETAMANPNQKSTEVFNSKSGVCKEITNLYVSMMRSLGISARVVSGYAYTDSVELVEFLDSNWGGHAWAEVLIGDVWVPFDLTYNQYGYVDATHIILKRSNHIDESSVNINASGYGFNIVKNSLKTENKFEVIEMKNYSSEEIYEVKISGPEELDIGSYGYLKVNIENLENNYNILFLNLGSVVEAEMLDDEKQMIIFRPNEEKIIYFRYKIDNLDEDYSYTFPFVIYNEFLREEYNVEIKKGYMNLKELALPDVVDETKAYSNNEVILSCEAIYDMPKNEIICSIKNPNNFNVEDFNICVEDICQIFNLKINDKVMTSFKTENENISVKYYYNKIKDNYINLNVLKPIFEVKSDFNNNSVLFEYNIENFRDREYIEVYLNDILIEIFTEKNNKFNLDLIEGNNLIVLNLKYKNEIIEEKEFKFYVEPTIYNLWEKILIWFVELFE